MSLKLLVIVGAPRSGTNVVRDILTSLPGFGTWPCDEINPIWRHGNCQRATDELQPEHATPGVRRYLRNAFEDATRRFVRDGSGVLVEKTCATSLRVPFVTTVFPEARFLHLVRDGRDASASALVRWTSGVSARYVLRKARFVPLSDVPTYCGRFLASRFSQIVLRKGRLPTWGPRFHDIDRHVRDEPLLSVCARQWSECVRQSTTALDRIGPDRVLRIRYEGLAANPAAGFTAVLDWLSRPPGPDTPWTAAFVDDGRRLHEAARQFRSDGVGRWKELVSPADMESVKPVLEPAMRMIGYAWA